MAKPSERLKELKSTSSVSRPSDRLRAMKGGSVSTIDRMDNTRRAYVDYVQSSRKPNNVLADRTTPKTTESTFAYGDYLSAKSWLDNNADAYKSEKYAYGNPDAYKIGNMKNRQQPTVDRSVYEALQAKVTQYERTDDYISNKYADRIASEKSKNLVHGMDSFSKLSTAGEGKYGDIGRYVFDSDYRKAMEDNRFHNGYKYSNLDKMNANEYSIFATFIDEGDYEGAKAFLDEIQVNLDRRNTEEIEQRIADNGGTVGSGVGYTLASAPIRAIGNITSGVGNVVNAAYKVAGRGKEQNPYSDANLLGNIANKMREVTRDSITKSGSTASKVAGFLYDTGNSMIDSAIGAMTMGTAYTPLMGFGAGTEHMRELYEQGATEEQALLGGALAGIAEATFEYLSLDHLVKDINPASVKEVVKYALTQAGIEGSEEVFTEIANYISDDAVMGTLSDRQRMINNLYQQGLTPEQIQTEVAKEFGKRVGLAFLGGAISGGILGGVRGATVYNQFNKTGREIRESGKSDDVVYSAEMLTNLAPDTFEQAKGHLDGVNGTPTDAELGALYYETRGINTVGTLEEEYRERAAEIRSNNNQMSHTQAMFEAVAEKSDLPDDVIAQARADYDGKMSPSAYLNNYSLAYTYGKEGIKTDYVALARKNIALAESQFKNAFEAGAKVRSADIEKISAIQQAAVEASLKSGKPIEAGKVDLTGFDYNGKHYDGIDFGKMSKSRASKVGGWVTLATALSEATGVNVSLYQGKVDEQGKHTENKNGFYSSTTNTIYIDVNASDRSGTRDAFVSTMSHELTHWIKDKANGVYEKMRTHILDVVSKERGLTQEELVLEQLGRMGDGSSRDDAIDEIVAQSCEDMLKKSEVAKRYLYGLDDNTKSKFVAELKRVFANIKAFFDKILSSAKGEWTHYETTIFRNLSEAGAELQKMWDEGFEFAIRYNQTDEFAKIGIGVDTETGTAVNSTKTTVYEVFDKLGYKSFDEAIADLSDRLAKSVGVSKEKAKGWLQAETSLASIILNDPENQKWLDYEADDRYDAIKTDTDYPQGTADFSNLCRKREMFTKMFANLQAQNPDTLFTANDIAVIRDVLTQKGIEAACALCYVEDRRQRTGEIANTFIEMYKKALKSESKKIIKKSSSGKTSELYATAYIAKRFGVAEKSPLLATDNYIPNQYDFVTYEGFRKLTEEHPAIAMAFEMYNRSRGQGSARLIEGHAEYKREILSYTPEEVARINNLGGMRIFSFSDFEAIHLIDLVQIISDCAVMGIKVQAYTKVPAFAKLVRNTGIKLNRSLIPANVGSEHAYALKDGKYVKVSPEQITERGIARIDGKEYLVVDTIEGIDVSDSNFLDESANRNIGNVIIGISDKQIRMAMTDPMVDYIIPFHSNQSKRVLTVKNINDWSNYKKVQEDKKTDAHTEKDAKKINIYEDIIYKYNVKTATEFVQRFVEACKANHLTPRFSEFLYDKNGNINAGYYKMLVDFKTFDANGNILPQETVRPDFNVSDNNDPNGIKFMNEILMADKERSINLQFSDDVMKEVKDRLAKTGKEITYKTKNSSKDDAYIDAVNRGDMESAQKMVEEAARLEGYDSPMLYHGTDKFGFTEIDVSKSDDKISFFAVDSLPVAESYISSARSVRNINGGNAVMDYDEEQTKAEARVWDESKKFADAISRYFSEWFWGYGGGTDYVYDIVSAYSTKLMGGKITKDDVDESLYNDLMEIVADAYYKFGDEYKDEYDDFAEWQSSEDGEAVADSIESLVSATIALGVFDKEYEGSGAYRLYANTTGMLVVDGLGQNWNSIPLPYSEELKYDAWAKDKYWKGRSISTRSLAEYAKDNGYSGVVFNNIRDNGGKKGSVPVANVYTFFDPQEQVKSADTVTYDEDGEIIPLSKRFNHEATDIRYSTKEDIDYAAAVVTGDVEEEERMVREAANKAGYNSPKLYHGTQAFGFTAFDLDKMDDNISIFTASNPNLAEEYTNTVFAEREELFRPIGKDKRYSPDTIKSLSSDELLDILNNDESIGLGGKYEAVDPAETQAKISEAERVLRDLARIGNAPKVAEVLINSQSEHMLEYHFDVYRRELWGTVEFSPYTYDEIWKAYWNLHRKIEGREYRLVSGGGLEEYTDAKIRESIKYKYGKGVYSLYGRTDNMYEVDADYAQWDEIDAKYIGKTRGYASTRDISEYAMAHGYDGVIIRDVYDNISSDYNERSDVYVYFHPSAVKSADPVTYDDEGRVIPLSKRFDSSKTDLRWSSKDDIGTERFSPKSDIFFSDTENLPETYDLLGKTEQIEAENTRINEDLKNWRAIVEQEKTLTIPTDDALKEIATNILSRTKMTGNVDTLVADLREAYSYMLSATNINSPAFFDKAGEIYDKLTMNGSQIEYRNFYENLLNEMKRTLKVTDMQKARLVSRYGGDKTLALQAWRGKLKISDNEKIAGQPLTEYWHEMQKKYPTLFKEVDEVDMAVELLKLADDTRLTLDTLNEYYNIEGRRNFAIELYNQLWQNSKLKTLADKGTKTLSGFRMQHFKTMTDLRESYQKKLAEAQGKNAKYEQKISELRKQRDERERAAIQRGVNRLQNYKTETERKSYIKRIQKIAKTLNEWLVTNSAKEHIVKPLQNPVAKFLAALDFSSERLLNGGEMTKKDISLDEAFHQVHQMVADIEAGKHESEGEADFLVSDLAGIDLPFGFERQMRTLMNRVNELYHMYGDNAYVLINMSLDDLEALNKVLVELRSIVRNANHYYAASNGARVEGNAESTILEMNSLRKRANEGKGLRDFFTWDNALPINAFDRFGDGGKAIFKALQDGQDSIAFKTAIIKEFLLGAYTKNELKEWRGNVRTFTLGGKEVKMTDAHLMSLYCLSKRGTAATRHMLKELGGHGISIDTFTDFKGLRSESIENVEGTTMTEAELKSMLATLSDRQRAVADKLQNYMTTVLSGWGNEVTNIRFGIDGFTEQNYFPIHSHSDFTSNGDLDKTTTIWTLANMGFTKELSEKANNMIVISDIFSEFASHASDMTRYSSLVLPVLDAYKWYTYKVTDKADNKTYSVRNAINTAYGKAAKTYIWNLMTDVNGQYNGGRGEGEFKRLVARYKQAAVAYNLRVALLQPTAYVRASLLIDPKYLAKGLTTSWKGGVEKAMKHSGIALWKSYGYFDTNIGKNFEELFINEETVWDKIREFGMKGAELGDRYTWGCLWNAVEAEIADKNPKTDKSSDEFVKAVSERFRDIIYRTQVADSTLTRSQLMRHQSGMVQGLTAFASESTVSYNLFQSIAGKMSDESRRTNKTTALQKYGKDLARASAVFTATSVLVALVEGMVDASRDDDDKDDKEGIEEYLAKFFEHTLTDFSEEMTIIGKVPVAKLVYTAARSLLTGEYYYGSTSMDTEVIDTTYKALNDWKKLFEGKDITAYKMIYDQAKAISQITGIAVNNIIREFKSAWNTLMELLGLEQAKIST